MKTDKNITTRRIAVMDPLTAEIIEAGKQQLRKKKEIKRRPLFNNISTTFINQCNQISLTIHCQTMTIHKANKVCTISLSVQ